MTRWQREKNSHPDYRWVYVICWYHMKVGSYSIKALLGITVKTVVKENPPGGQIFKPDM